MSLVKWIADKRHAWLAARDLKRYHHELSVWDAEHDALEKELQLAIAPGGFGHAMEGLGIVLRKSEDVFLVLTGAALVEPKQLPGHWVGSYNGVSLRLMKGVTYHTGGSRGTYVPGPQSPAPVAVGTATITNQRVVFQSNQQAREFLYSKLLGYQHDPSSPLTYFQVSNRQKVSGVGYDLQSARTWRFRLSLALAHFNGESPNFAQHMRDEVSQHDLNKPRLIAP